jgi:hypothetical protein
MADQGRREPGTEHGRSARAQYLATPVPNPLPVGSAFYFSERREIGAVAAIAGVHGVPRAVCGCGATNLGGLPVYAGRDRVPSTSDRVNAGLTLDRGTARVINCLMIDRESTPPSAKDCDGLKPQRRAFDGRRVGQFKAKRFRGVFEFGQGALQRIDL